MALLHAANDQENHIDRPVCLHNDNYDAGAAVAMVDKFVFFHIGKTGGTSLRNAIENACETPSCSPPFVQSHLDRSEANDLSKYKFICGHISRADQETWFGNRKIFSILRSPIDRCFSFIHYVKNLPQESSRIAFDAKEMAVSDLIETKEAQINLNNTVVRQLGGHLLEWPEDWDGLLEAAKVTLSQCCWVGFSHSLQADYTRLSKQLCLSSKLAFDNVTLNRPKISSEPADVRDQLHELTRYDRKLWDWALDRFGAAALSCTGASKNH